MSLNEQLLGNGKDQCGYTFIKPPDVDQMNSVYQFTTYTLTNISIDNNPLTITFSPKALSSNKQGAKLT
jgi:hypothetical protein